MKIMKKLLFSVAFILMLILSPVSVAKPEIKPLTRKANTNTKSQKSNKTSLQLFMERIAFYESRNHCKAISKSGKYIGKYQFSYQTIKGLGFNISRKTFLGSDSLQDVIMIKFIKANELYLHRYINKYVGKKVRNINITKAGILAAAQGGPLNAIAFFKGHPSRNAIKYYYMFQKFNLKVN
jgi:hypothetical protein